MTDKQIVEALLDKDSNVTVQFFFRNCRPLFLSIINRVFQSRVDYDELINEFYLYLMEQDGRRLRQFEGRSSIYQWMKVTAIRYFRAMNRRMGRESESLDDHPDGTAGSRLEGTVDDRSKIESGLDMEALLGLMANKRYAYALRRLVSEDGDPEDVARELDVSVANLYNIKRRAIAALTKMALDKIDGYGK